MVTDVSKTTCRPHLQQPNSPRRRLASQKFEVLTYIAAEAWNLVIGGLRNQPAEATVSDRTLPLRKFQSHTTDSYAIVLNYIVTVFLS
jgi:hypothetical protein